MESSGRRTTQQCAFGKIAACVCVFNYCLNPPLKATNYARGDALRRFSTKKVGVSDKAQAIVTQAA